MEFIPQTRFTAKTSSATASLHAVIQGTSSEPWQGVEEHNLSTDSKMAHPRLPNNLVMEPLFYFVSILCSVTMDVDRETQAAFYRFCLCLVCISHYFRQRGKNAEEKCCCC